LGEHRIAHLDIDPLLRSTQDVDALGAGNGVELVAHMLRKIAQLVHREIGRLQRQRNDRDIAELVVDDWRHRTFGELAHSLLDLFVQFVPRLIKIVGGEGDFGMDNRLSLH
jgi:hypothetical protein